MNILALETSTEACSAALLSQGLIVTRFEIAPRRHTDLILPMLEEVIAEAGISKSDIDAIAFGNGPGAFTGVRIATSIAQGLAFSLDVPVIPVSTLAAMAQQAMDLDQVNQVATALDARMNEVYFSTFEKDAEGYTKETMQAVVIPPAKVSMPKGKNWVAVGNAWEVYAAEFNDDLMQQIISVKANIYPAAGEIARIAQKTLKLGDVQSIEQALPVYIRDTVTHKPS